MFSLSNRYFSRVYNSFGELRVINEDRVEPSQGFGRHSHSEMEIFSYIVSGELEHKDSMGNLEIMKRGDVQVCAPFVPHFVDFGNSPSSFLRR